MNPETSSSKVLVASTPETQQEDSQIYAPESQFDESTVYSRLMALPSSRLEVERDPGVFQALGPTSQLDPPPPPSFLSSSSTLPAQPLRPQSSSPQSTQSQTQPALSNPKSSGISSVSGILEPDQQSLVSNVSAMSDSQPFRYDRSIEHDVESQESQFQPTQLDSQSTPRTQSTDNEDSSMDTAEERSIDVSQQKSTSELPTQANSSGTGDSSGRKGEEQKEEEEERPKKKSRVSFLPSSSHPAEDERSNPTGTPLVRTTSKILVAETPQQTTPPVSSSPSSSSLGQAGPSRSTPLAAATRPSSPLSSAHETSTGSALKGRGSSSSDATVRRQPPSISRKEPSLVLGSQAPPSPTQASSSSTRLSVPAPQAPAPLLSRNTSQASHHRPPRSPAPRSSSQIPETQPTAAASDPPLPSHRFGSTGSTTTIPATASNPSGSSPHAPKTEEEEDELIDELDPVQVEDEEDQESDFGNSDQEQDSGERAQRAWFQRQGKSLYAAAEEKKSLQQREKETRKGKGREERVKEDEQEEEEEDEVEDFSNVMDDHDIPTSSNLHQAPRPPTPPRRRPSPTASRTASPQSSDPLAAEYISQRTHDSLPPPLPSTALQTDNAIAGPSKPALKAPLSIRFKHMGPPAPPHDSPSSLFESQSQDVLVVDTTLSQLDEESQQLPLHLGGGGMDLDTNVEEDNEEDMAESNLPLAMQVPSKRRVSDVEREEREDRVDGSAGEERGGKRSKTIKEKKGKQKAVEEEEEEEADTPARSTRGSDRGRGASRGGRGGKRGRSAATSNPPAPTSKSTTATTSRNHLARTPARVQAPVDEGTQDSDDETIEDADDSTWEAGPSKSKKKASSSAEQVRTDDEDEDEDDHGSSAHDAMEVDGEMRRGHDEEEHEEPESLAPPPKRSPTKKTPYGSKGKSRGLPPPPLPPLTSNGRDKRRRSISESNGGSPAPSLPSNAEAGPSRRLQLPSNASSDRVLAPWGKSKSYYPATVTNLTSKSNTYAIDFDDNDTGTAVLSALRKCIFKAGDVFSYEKTHYVVAQDQEDGEPVQKGDVIRAYKKGGPKTLKNVPIERVLVQSAFVDQFSDRTVVASDLLLHPSVRGSTRAATRPPSINPSVASSSSTANKGKGRARTSIPGVAFPTGRGSFQGIGFVLTNCHNPEALRKMILSNGGTVANEIDSFWSVGGIKSAAEMPDQEYQAEELRWNDALGKELRNVLLVADGPSRKPKMMKATALGVPCVSRKWIDIARTEKTIGWLSWLLPKPRSYYNDREDVLTQAILDAWGKDPEALYNPVSYSDHRERPLDGMRILCLLETVVERELVTFTALAMGAASVILETDLSNIDLDSADIFVLPDHQKVPKILATNSHKLRIVDVEWVYQTVIHGQRRKEQPLKKLVEDLLTREAAEEGGGGGGGAEGSAKKGKKGGR
ncbi:hypothetical protein BDY24DRAFT_411731 [Mrakia frigida]|uniref:uncharacterized protein n=1 Tax=Mrakia frigida TaxID=29902 RepID=UPI003FCC1F90